MLTYFHRCSLCNRTDNEEAIESLEDFATCSFIPDPKDPNFDICMECFEEIQDSLFEFDEPEFDSYESVED